MVLLTLILLTSVNIAALQQHTLDSRLFTFDLSVLGCVVFLLCINYIPKKFWSAVFGAIYTSLYFIFSGQCVTSVIQKCSCRKTDNQEEHLQATQQELQPLPLHATHYNKEVTEPITLPIHKHPAGVNFRKEYPQLRTQVDEQLALSIVAQDEDPIIHRI